MNALAKRISTLSAIAAAIALPSIAHAAILSYTDAVQTYVVPAGVTEIQVSLWGAGGGNAGGAQGFGSAGAYVTGDLSVTPNETLYIIVGGAGSNGGSAFGSINAGGAGGFGGGGIGGANGSAGALAPTEGFSGGGGGGYSGIFTSPTITGPTALVVAGGGGGGGTGGGFIGTSPTLTAGDGTNLVGGTGGAGGTGGSGDGRNGRQGGPGGNGGGGAGGGFNGGIAGANGATGTNAAINSNQNGGAGGNGSNGVAAGSYLTLLTNSSASVAPTDYNGVGGSDPDVNPNAMGALDQNGEVAIEIVATAAPEPASLALLSTASAALLLRKRRK